jgi:predicted DNA-binding transcriptional regulator AlpA
MERRLLGIKELGEYLGIGSQTIRNRLSCGTFPIPAKKVCGRVKFDRRDVEKYLDRLKPSYAKCEDREARGVDSKGSI